MAYLDKYTKQPAEIKIYQIDYSEWLSSGETVTSVSTSVELLNPESGDVGEPTLTITNTTLPGSGIFQYYVNAGTDGKVYKVTFQADTSYFQLQESEIQFKVVDT